MFILALTNEPPAKSVWFLHEGPSGYAWQRGRAKAKRFATREDAEAFAKHCQGEIEVQEA